MTRAARTVLLLIAAQAIVGCAAESGQAKALTLHASVNRRVNAVYHTACLAESLACTRPVFQEWWKSRLAWAAADAAAIDRWRQVMKEVSDGTPARPGTPIFLNAPQFHPAQSAREAILVAAIEAPTGTEFRQRTSPRLSPAQADRLIETIDHIESRLAPLWPADRQPLDARMRAVEDAAAKMGMPRLAAAVSAFLDARLPSPDVYVDGIVAPDPTSSSYSATQIGGHLLAELVDAMPAEEIVSGALHELTHYIYNLAPREKHLALVDEFLRLGGAPSVGFYTYLNEAIASASQGLLARRLGERPSDDKAYDHPYIAPLGAATVPLLDDVLQRRGTLFSGFVSRYLDAGTAALKGKADEPRFVLSATAIVVSSREEDQRLASTYVSTMVPQSSGRFSDESLLARYPDANVVRFVRYDAIVPAIPDAEAATLRTHRAFGYITRRGQYGLTVILAGRDAAAIEAAIAKLAGLPTLRFNGTPITFTVD